MSLKLAIAAALVCAVAVPAAAAPSIDRRQAEQRARIHRGVVTGALTPAEVARLGAQQRAIAHEERIYRVGGLQPWERADLQRDLDRAGRAIRHQAHDRQRRF